MPFSGSRQSVNREQAVRLESPSDHFDNLKTESKSPQINLKSVYGVSILRDNPVVVGSATVTNSSGEYLLSTGTTTSSTSILDTVEYGRYQAGMSAQWGIGIRLSSEVFVSDQYAQWGYYDDNNGMGFGIDATGKYVFVRRGGIDTKTYKSSWNGNPLDSTAFFAEVDYTDGLIFQCDFSWYGYGIIEWGITLVDRYFNQRPVVINQTVPSGANSIETPNLPLRVEVSNGGTTDNKEVFVGGRQFSVIGRYTPNLRLGSERRLSQTGIGLTPIPTVSFRKKAGYEEYAVRISGIDIVTDAPLLYAVYLGGSLTGASFADPTDTDPNETSLESDVSATAISATDFLIAEGLIPASGVGSGAVGSLTIDNLNIILPNNTTVTLAVRRITGTGSTVSSVFRMSEEW